MINGIKSEDKPDLKKAFIPRLGTLVAPTPVPKGPGVSDLAPALFTRAFPRFFHSLSPPPVEFLVPFTGVLSFLRRSSSPRDFG